MKYLLNAQQMSACDRATIEEFLVPQEVLMERAALAVRDAVLERYPEKRRILVICGSGNNGGDGYACARLLNQAGRYADVLFVGKHDKRTKLCALQAEIFLRYGGKELPDESSLNGYDLILDALFGTGLKREVIGRYADVIRAVNNAGAPVAAVDIPSGISADTGHILGCAVMADITVTMQYAKLGQMLYPGASCCGEIIVCDIGITSDRAVWDSDPVYMLQEEDLPSMLPARRSDAHKGMCGRLLLIAGARNMAGAACLAASAAIRCGCGIVKILSHEDNRIIVQSSVPEALFAPWPADNDVSQHLKWADAVAVGPGLGLDYGCNRMLRSVLSSWEGPLVLDADALNLISEDSSLFSGSLKNAVITPHPGEMSRLSALFEDGGMSGGEVLADLVGTAVRAAKALGCVTVLKGARTVVCSEDQVCLNVYGNDGMASGGSGDVLTGIIGSLAAQGADPADAAGAGVLIHALAGDAAARDMGRRSMKAGDIIDFIPRILKDASYS